METPEEIIKARAARPAGNGADAAKKSQTLGVEWRRHAMVSGAEALEQSIAVDARRR